MKIPFQTPARKRIVAAIAIVLAALYVGLASREFLASWLGGRPELTSLERAARLDPGNAEYRNHLGRYFDLVNRDPATAVGYYKAAVQLNPHSARYWFDLAGVYQVLGDTASQTKALEQAIHADSMTPDVAWEAANLYLVQGQNEKALREFSVVMANDISLTGSAVQFCWRINPDVDSLLRNVVPHTSDAYIAFLALLEKDVNLLLSKLTQPTEDVDVASLTQQINQDTHDTFKVWDALMQTGQPFELRYVYDYIQFLVQRKEVDQTVLVWQQAAARFGLSSYLPSSANLVVNGTFNLDVLNGGFDWQYQKQSGVTLTLDPSDFHAGRRSLLIAFDGPGITDAGIFQLVAVQPNTAYDFTAYYKNGELEGAGGPHFTIQDMYSQVIYFDSDELNEAGFWKSVDGEFTTGPDCKLVVLHVRRLPAGSPIRGKLWVDDFHLVRKPS
jgi:tetratricopeptide (TPR) repeat protein